MDEERRESWLPAALVAAVLYTIIGVATAALARGAPGHPRAWRLAAWGLSAVVFAAHLWREHRRSALAAGAWHACLAVMVATAAIAALAIAHNYSLGELREMMVFSFVIWPVLTGLASFGVALFVLIVWRNVSGVPTK